MIIPLFGSWKVGKGRQTFGVQVLSSANPKLNATQTQPRLSTWEQRLLLWGKEEQLNGGSFYLSITTKLLKGEIHTSASNPPSRPCPHRAVRSLRCTTAVGRMECSATVGRRYDCLMLEEGLDAKLLRAKTWTLKTHRGVLQSVAVSTAVRGHVWLRSGENNLLVCDTAQTPRRTRPRPSASGHLSLDVSGLHMVAYFNSRLPCTEVVWGNRVKCFCIKRLKTTYVNSGFQPKLPSCLAETGS